MNEFRFPKIVVHEIHEEEGRLFRDSLTSPICDFCFDERVEWTYECEDYQLELSTGSWASYNGWAACGTCSDLIEKRAWNDLIARHLRSEKLRGIRITPNLVADAGSILFGFVDHYTPGRIAFG